MYITGFVVSFLRASNKVLSLSMSGLKRPWWVLSAAFFSLFFVVHGTDNGSAVVQVMLGREQKRLEEEAQLRRESAERLVGVLEGLAKARQLDGIVSLGAVEKAYRELKDNYSEEYDLYNIAAAAMVQVCCSWCSSLLQKGMACIEVHVLAR